MKENRIRRMAERQGYMIRKSRRRDPRAIDYGGYMLIEASRNLGILGVNPNPYSATLDEIESFLVDDGRDAKKRKEGKRR